jgi:hypothetical protein
MRDVDVEYRGHRGRLTKRFDRWVCKCGTCGWTSHRSSIRGGPQHWWERHVDKVHLGETGVGGRRSAVSATLVGVILIILIVVTAFFIITAAEW